MNRLPLDQQILLIVQTAALTGLTVRLWWNGLYRRYSYFFVYLLLAVLQTLSLAFVPFSSRAYLWAWVITEGLIVCSYVLVVLETYSIVLHDFHGLATIGPRFIKGAVGLAVTVSLLLFTIERIPDRFFRYFLICDRVILSSLVFFVLLLTAFLLYYPIPLSRNAIFYSIGYAGYFLVKAAALLITNVSLSWYRELGTVLITVSTGCLFFWLFTLSRSGEQKIVVIGHGWSREDELRVLTQLRAINARVSHPHEKDKNK